MVGLPTPKHTLPLPSLSKKQDQKQGASCFLPLSNMHRGFTSDRRKASILEISSDTSYWEGSQVIHKSEFVEQREVKSMGLLLVFHGQKINHEEG